MPGFYPGTCVRKGDWKLTRFYGGSQDGSDKLEVYKLKDDIGENQDLKAQNPQIAAELNNLITDFLKDTEAVVPKLNPAVKVAAGPTNK